MARSPCLLYVSVPLWFASGSKPGGHPKPDLDPDLPEGDGALFQSGLEAFSIDAEVFQSGSELSKAG